MSERGAGAYHHPNVVKAVFGAAKIELLLGKCKGTDVAETEGIKSLYKTPASCGLGRQDETEAHCHKIFSG